MHRARQPIRHADHDRPCALMAGGSSLGLALAVERTERALVHNAVVDVDAQARMRHALRSLIG